jgi:hypothetical protein
VLRAPIRTLSLLLASFLFCRFSSDVNFFGLGPRFFPPTTFDRFSPQEFSPKNAS